MEVTSDSPDHPAAFSAATLHVYVAPMLKGPTGIGENEPVVKAEAPPSVLEHDTRNAVTWIPPSSGLGANDTVAVVVFTDAVAPVGA
jgi:hypothetical protein